MDRTPRLVALYACQPHEPTVERPMPPDGAAGTRHGLLTYTVCQILTRAESRLTYRELAQRIQGQTPKSNCMRRSGSSDPNRI